VGTWDLERKERKEGKTGENHDNVTYYQITMHAKRLTTCKTHSRLWENISTVRCRVAIRAYLVFVPRMWDVPLNRINFEHKLGESAAIYPGGGPPSVLDLLPFFQQGTDSSEARSRPSRGVQTGFFNAGFAFALIDNTAAFFDEGLKQVTSMPILQVPIVGTAKWDHTVADGAVKPGGVWLEGLFPDLIVDIKDKLGLGGDPFLQGSIAHNKVVTQEKACFIPLTSLCSAEMLPKVCAVPGALKSTDCLHCADGEPSHRIGCCFHRAVSIRRRTALDYPLCRIPCFEQGTCTFWESPNLPNWLKFCDRAQHLTKPGPLDVVSHLTEIFSKVDRLFGTRLQNPVNEANKHHTVYLQGRGFQAKPRLKRFWSNSPRNTTTQAAHKLLASHDPPRPSPILLHARHRQPVCGHHAIHPGVRGRAPSQSLAMTQPYGSTRGRVRGSLFASQGRPRIWRPPGREPTVLAE